MCIRPLVLFLLLGLFEIPLGFLHAANRPDIRWMRGGNGDAVKALAYSPDGKWVASGTELKLWRVSDGMLLRTFDAVSVGSIAFSSDGKWLFGGDGDRLKAWSTETGEVLWEIEGHAGSVSAVSYLPERRSFDETVLAGYSDGTVKLWDPGDRGLELNVTNLSGQVFSASFSPNGKYFFSAGDFVNGVNLWNTRSGALIRTFTNSDFAPVAIFSPNGLYVAAASSPSFPQPEPIKLWRTESGKLVKRFPISNWIRALAFSRDGSTIHAGDQTGEITRWDIKSGKRVDSFVAHAGSVRALASHPSGDGFVSGGTDNAIKLWTKKDQPVRSFTEHSGAITEIAASRNGKLAASASSDGTVRLWRTSSGRRLHVLNQDFPVLDVAFSPDARRVASLGKDGSLKMWNAATGRLLWLMNNSSDSVSGGVEFSADGRTVVIAGFDGKFRFFRAADGANAGELPAPGGRINALLYSPDGTRLITGGHSNVPLSRAYVAVVNATNGSSVWSAQPDDVTTLSIAVSPDGELIASGGTAQNIPNGTVKLWRASDGALVRTLESQSVEILSLCFSADGALLISTDAHTMKVWRVADGVLLSTFTREVAGVESCARIPNSTSFIYGRVDGTVVRAELVETWSD